MKRIIRRASGLLAILSFAMASTMQVTHAQTTSKAPVIKVEERLVQSQIYGLGMADGYLLYTQEGEGSLYRINPNQPSSPPELVVQDEQLKQPRGLAVSKDQSIYLADSKQNQILVIRTDRTVAILAGKGTEGLQDGPSDQSAFHGPSDIAIGLDGKIYVADTLNHRIRQIDAQGNVVTVAGSGSSKDEDGWLIGGYKDGKALEAQFNEPSAIAFDSLGNLYIADTGNQRIRKLSVKGQVTTVAGSGTERIEGRYIKGGYRDGQAASAQFNYPLGLTVANDGTIYVADTWNNCIRAISLQGYVKTVAGSETHGRVDGWGVEAQLDGPTDVALGAKGSLYVADRWNRSVRVLTPVALGENPRIVWNGQPLVLKQKPIIKNQQTYLPLREFASKLGFQLEWNPLSKELVLVKGNERTVIPSTQTLLFNGVTMVPVNQVKEALHVSLKWIPEYQLIELMNNMPQGK